MMTVERILEGLRRDIHLLNKPDLAPEQIQRLHFLELGGLFHVEFYGEAGGEGFDLFATGISNQDVAPAIASIRISGPDEGINGTRGWAVSLLAAAAVPFANLRYLHVQQMLPTDHNRTIIGDYEECGIIADIAAKAPVLTALTVPSAPSREFFGVGLQHLAYLNVDAGYDTQDFILNLSQSAGFPNLTCLEWGEYCESYMDDWRDRCTPFDHYKALFGSEAFRPVKRFVFRNPACSDAELAELKAMRPSLQMMVVRSTGEYVSARPAPVGV
jgi:hypothetical protein